jgi:hypothetical protein
MKFPSRGLCGARCGRSVPVSQVRQAAVSGEQSERSSAKRNVTCRVSWRSPVPRLRMAGLKICGIGKLARLGLWFGRLFFLTVPSEASAVGWSDSASEWRQTRPSRGWGRPFHKTTWLSLLGLALHYPKANLLQLRFPEELENTPRNIRTDLL